MNKNFKSGIWILAILSVLFMSFSIPEKEYMIFQFPRDMIPRIDGDFSDWEMIPDLYNVGISELKNTVYGQGQDQDPLDFDLNVKVGWVKDLNRIYFYIDAYDDFWDFNSPELKQDIFELVVDGNRSGGSFIDQKNWDFNARSQDRPFFNGDGTEAQNYHIFLPAMNKDWSLPWGNYPWIKEFPFANQAYNYHFKQGESGRLQLEFYITPFDFASFDGPDNSTVSQLKENEVIGISWSILDFDGKMCESFMNLSHDIRMISNASYLHSFRLMPLIDSLKSSIKADYKFKFENDQKTLVHFYDNSEGEISKWHWDFGDGDFSDEQNPVHLYSHVGVWTIILKVDGPGGISSRSKVWEVVTNSINETEINN